MKTHEFARALMLLARMLKSGQDVDLKDWRGPVSADSAGTGNGNRAADAGLALGVLTGLSRYKKSQWRSLILEWGIPIEIRITDSVRDVVGKTLNYLEVHPEVAERITSDATKKSSKASPELVKVLSILLGEGKDKDETEQTGEARNAPTGRSKEKGSGKQ